MDGYFTVDSYTPAISRHPGGVIEVTYTSIEDRLAASRNRALVRSFTHRASTVADRAPVYAPGERRSQVRTIIIAVLAMALAGLVIAVSGVADQSALRVQIFALTADEANFMEGFAVGIRIQPVNDSNPAQIAKLRIEMRTALREQFDGFVTLKLVSKGGDQTLLLVAQFTEQVALERIAAALTLVFEEFLRTQVSISFDQGSSVKLTEE